MCPGFTKIATQNFGCLASAPLSFSEPKQFRFDIHAFHFGGRTISYFRARPHRAINPLRAPIPRRVQSPLEVAPQQDLPAALSATSAVRGDVSWRRNEAPPHDTTCGQPVGVNELFNDVFSGYKRQARKRTISEWHPCRRRL